MSKATVSKFIKQTIALITGDDAEKTAVRIERKASTGVRSELILQEQEVVNLEDRLIDAKENVTRALSNNGILIEDMVEYMRNLVSAGQAVDHLEEEIEDRKELLDFLQYCQDTLNS